MDIRGVDVQLRYVKHLRIHSPGWVLAEGNMNAFQPVEVLHAVDPVGQIASYLMGHPL
jgi:hypothetical protein